MHTETLNLDSACDDTLILLSSALLWNFAVSYIIVEESQLYYLHYHPGPIILFHGSSESLFSIYHHAFVAIMLSTFATMFSTILCWRV